MSKRRNRHNRNYYVVRYTFNDEGRRQKKFLRVPKGCRFLYNVRFGQYGQPSFFKGHKIVGWVNTYSADDAEADEYSPIIRISRHSLNMSKNKKKVGFSKNCLEAFSVNFNLVTFISHISIKIPTSKTKNKP